jgi:drug/metabolite transporter superfamily protein YnfA
MKPRRWQDWGNVILGAWLVASPWVLSFTDNAVASRSSWVLGAAIVLFAGIAMYMPKAWEEAVTILLGLCLLLSPWVLQFTEQQAAIANAALVGILVVALGIWAMALDTDFKKWWDQHHPQGTTH